MPAGDVARWTSRLRQERVRRNWRQADLAEALETSVVTIQRWETGKHQPRAYLRLKLCALFGKSADDLGFDDLLPAAVAGSPASQGSVEVALPEKIALWNVPHARNPYFTGREDLLERLQEQLRPRLRLGQATPRWAALTQAQAIKGLGGIGKTQIAVEYAYRAAEQGHYTHILWLHAGSEEALLASFVALAHLLPVFPTHNETDQHQLVTVVTSWLEECTQPWLLIADNADDLSLIQQYLPQRGLGSLLLTTRAHAVGALATSLEVETMGWVEGMQLLLHRVQRWETSEQDRDEAMNVAMALDGFPLALDQAGAYIEETGCSFGEYLQIYQQRRKELLARRGKQANTYPDSVATTWALSFAKVEQASPAAVELLQLAAFLAPDRIPEELLTGGAMYWPEALQRGVTDPFAFNQMLEVLLAFSLVKRLTEQRLLSVHRLVQAVQQDAMDANTQCQWAERVVRGVQTIFPSDPKNDLACWPICLRYLDQAQVCDELIQRYRLEFLEAAELLEYAGTYLREHASYTLAEPLYQRALRIREQRLGPEHPLVAFALTNLAVLYYSQGMYAQAEPLYQRALRIREQHLGPEHPEVAYSLNGLANLRLKQGKYAEAEPLYQRALQIEEQRVGPEHPDLAATLNNLAIFYKVQDKYAQAELLYQRALRINEQQLGPEHPHLAYPLNNLALLYKEQGKHAEAEPLCRRALQIWEQHLGPEHPGVAHPLNSLAELYTRQEKYGEAETLYQQALSVQEQHLGPEHPEVALSLHGLANLRLKQGKYTEAEPLYQRALHIREHALGPLHPETAQILHDFAILQEIQGHFLEAASLYQRTLTIYEQLLGREHAQTSETRERLRVTVGVLGRTAVRLEAAQQK